MRDPEPPDRRLLIAGRGEIARRLLRSARARGYRVAVVSTAADRGSPVRLEADRMFEVPSFLDAEAVVAKARGWGATALHPAYGFLSENAGFSEAVERAGIAFVGPTAAAMRLLGDKEAARRLALEVGAPLLPGLSSEALRGGSDPAAAVEAAGIGFPCVVKASAGGGGIGIRVVRKASALAGAVEAASRQAAAAFGDGTVFVERWLDEPRHVEIQVFGDGRGSGIHLGERECSVQRRRQKLIEWAPAFGMTPSLRRRMGEAALRLVAASRYRGAGTVEFLLDGDGAFWFLEVNTRLQVEHPVTEAVAGVDMVDAQLALAEGTWPESLPRPASSPEAFVPQAPQGAAIEARVVAESPGRDFAPSPGMVRRFAAPKGVGIRVDSGIGSGTPVPPGFDSLLLKLIAAGSDLDEAADRLEGALADLVVHGVETNRALLAAVLRHPDFREGRTHSAWVEERLADLTASTLPDALRDLLRRDRVAEALAETAAGRTESTGARRFRDLGRGAGASERFPLVRPGRRPGEVLLSHPVLVEAGLPDPLPVAVTRLPPDPARGETEGSVAASVGAETIRLPLAGGSDREAGPGAGGDVLAPLAGRLLRIRDEAGAEVSSGEVVAVMESMKMHWEIRAPAPGRLGAPQAAPGDTLPAGALLLRVTP